jgi:hypothetical protein
MTAVIPKVKVQLKKTQLINRPGMSGKVAVIGAFDTLETEPKLFSTVGEAQATFGSDGTNYNGCAVIPYLFKGASSLLCVNITTESSGTRSKTITTTNLTNALAKIKGEDWDILFIAEPLTDTFIPIINAFVKDCFELKYPCGYIGCLTGQTTSANVTSAGLTNDWCYGLTTQAFTVDGVTLSVLESSAYYCGLIAGMNVGNTMTYKTVDGVTAISPELSFETGGEGKALLEAGITTVKCASRTDKRYIVVNSEQPNGLDLYINRTRDFIVKEMALHQFLGERNREATLNEIKQELDRVKDMCVNTLDLLEDIQYSVEKKNANCVDIYLDSLVFAGIITEIDVYVRVEVI